MERLIEDTLLSADHSSHTIQVTLDNKVGVDGRRWEEKAGTGLS